MAKCLQLGIDRFNAHWLKIDWKGLNTLFLRIKFSSQESTKLLVKQKKQYFGQRLLLQKF